MAAVDRAGVKIAYDDVGSGLPLVFVHGGFCDRSNWEFQSSYFKDTHRVVTIDLPGHGESSKPEYDYSFDRFADDVAWVCSALDVSRPVIVGHSMGGCVALAVAGRHPDLPAAIALLEPALILSDLSQSLASPLAAFQGSSPAELRDSILSFFTLTGFASTDDQERKAAILQGMAAVPEHVMAALWKMIFAWNAAPVAESCTLPMLFVGSGAPLTDLARLKELCPQVVIGRTVGSGHWAMLDIPDQINAMLAQFIRHADALADTSRAVPW